MKNKASLIPAERIHQAILLIRGQKVLLDRDLAILYRVPTRQLNKAVSRNMGRFPEDFMFQLTGEEHKNLMFHFGTSSWGGVRKRPRAFTEQGVAMLSSVLRSKKAVQVNIRIMRVFVKFREFLFSHKDLAHELEQQDRKLSKHEGDIQKIFSILHYLTAVPKKSKGPIGFQH